MTAKIDPRYDQAGKLKAAYFAAKKAGPITRKKASNQ